MVKQLLTKLVLLVATVLMGAGTAWAEDVTFTFNTDAGIGALGITKPSSGAGTNLATDKAYTLDGVSMTVTSGGTATRIWNSSGTLDLRIYKDGTLTLTAPGNISSIVLTGTTTNVFSTTVGSFNSGTWSCGEASVKTVTLTATGTGKINTIKVTYASGSSSTDPSITASDVDIDYDETSGSIGYTISNEPSTPGILSAEVPDGSWLTLGTISATAVPFTCAANSETTERTETVTLTYTYGSESVTKDVTVTQAGAPVVYTTIPDLFAAATTAGTNVNVTFGNWVVSGVSGSSAYVTDNNGNGFIIYKSSHGFAVNDKLSGTVNDTPLKLYKGAAEFTAITSTTTGLTVSDDGAITVLTNKTIADLGGVNTGAVITLSNLTYDGTNLSDGTNTIKPYSTLFAGTFESGKKYNVTGVYVQYDDTKEILPRSAADIEEVLEPTISLSETSINVDAADASGSIDVTYNNLTNFDSEVLFVASDGVTSATYDWLDAEIDPTDATVLNYVIDENTSTEARTAYMVVYALGTEGEATSDLITVTQAGYVAPATAGNWVGTTSLANINENDVFVIVGNNGNPYAMSNDNGTSKAPDAVAVTVVDGTLSGTIEDKIKWNVSYDNDNDGYIFYPNSSTTTWLYCINNNNGVRVGTGENKYFIVDDDYLYNIGQTRYVGIYSSQDWRCYKINNNVFPTNIENQTFTYYKQLAAKLNASGYATFSTTAPVDFSKATDFTAWAITSISGTAITFSQLTGVVAGGTGVLLKGTAGETVYPSVAADASAAVSPTNKLVGITNATPITANSYYGLSGNTFVKVGAGTVPAGKALLPANLVSGARTLTFIFEDEATGISTIDHSSLTVDNSVYNLNGQRVGNPKKGLYIVNGKKVLVK
ncbi:MAG: hypothetical protein J6Z14_07580 [Prevotella sp.]|nr:hypothetical protein [Prevotella sp.]